MSLPKSKFRLGLFRRRINGLHREDEISPSIAPIGAIGAGAPASLGLSAARVFGRGRAIAARRRSSRGAGAEFHRPEPGLCPTPNWLSEPARAFWRSASASRAKAKPNRHAAPAPSSLGVRARPIVVISDCDG